MAEADSETAENDSSSCLNEEYETFPDEVPDQIPEVDSHGRMNRSKSVPAGSLQDTKSELQKRRNRYMERGFSELDDSQNMHNSPMSLRCEKPISFLKVLLSPRTPYEEFHRLFKNTPRDQFPINDFSCALSREILLQGRIYISQGWFCFYSNIFGWETQVTIDCSKVRSISREKTAYIVPNAILICSEDGEKHFFSSFLSRETVYKLLVNVWNEASKHNKAKKLLRQDSIDVVEDNDAPAAEGENLDETEEKDHSSNKESDDNVDNNRNPCAESRQGRSREEDSGCCECQSEHNTTDRTATHDRHSWANSRFQKDKDTTEIISFKPAAVHGLSQQEPLRITDCGLAMLLASAAETLYSYLQVSFQLLRRLRSEQIFVLVSSFLIVILLLCSGFLLYRLSILESKVLGAPLEPEKIIMHQSMKQVWSLREQVFHAEMNRLKSIVSANLNAIQQVKDTLKMLQDNLTVQTERNCTPLDNGTCLKIT